MKRLLLPACAIVTVGTLVFAGWSQGLAQQDAVIAAPEDTRAAMLRAERERDAASARAEALEAAAITAREEAEKTARRAAALAARIQQAEAEIELAETRYGEVSHSRRALAEKLAQRRQPVVRLTAALQRFARRPVALSVMRPGTVGEMVYMRALLSSTLPEVRRRTAALREEVERGEALEREAATALAALRAGERELGERRAALDALATRQTVASRETRGAANREAELALALAEEARDLDALVGRLDEAGALREKLAALPGPILRPARPEQSEVMPAARPDAGDAAPPPGYRLPVAGRTVAGFGAQGEDGSLSKGLALAPRQGAQVVAPAAGRVVFAGPYRGYGRIVILEHEGGWTSLVTGLARTDVQVGDELLGGAPLGIAPQRQPLISLELRRAGEPVNPLEYLG